MDVQLAKKRQAKKAKNGSRLNPTHHGFLLAQAYIVVEFFS